MSRSKDALEKLFTEWSTFRAQFPHEGHLGTVGYPSISYTKISDMFVRWKSIVDAVEEKNAWEEITELAFADSVVADAVTRVKTWLRNGRSNGIEWLFQTDFVRDIGLANKDIESLARKRIEIAKVLARALSNGLEAKVDSVVNAAAAARDLQDKYAESLEKIANLHDADEAGNKIHETLQNLQRTIEEMETLAKQYAGSAESALGEAVQAKSAATVAKGEIEALKASALAREAELESRAQHTNEVVDDLKSEADKAMASVTQALRMARDQGLAGSFQRRSGILKDERRLWTIGFIGAGLILLTTGFAFVLDLPDLSYESLVSTLLKKAALIAPAIWVGWYSAKQITRISRVQEDYEYKAASALAYQSYRDEARLSPDNTLGTQLLSRAIATFGENPVRLYEDSKAETHSPMEELLSKIKPEKLADLLAAALAKKMDK